MTDRQLNFNTLAVHAGYQPDPTTGARAVPIYQTTAYQFHDTDHAARLFALQEPGNIYTRIMNPTNAVFEERLTALEKGVGGLVLASGQAAETLALLNTCQAGDEIVASSALYGGTYTLLAYTLKRMGITTHFVDSLNPDDLAAKINDKTRLIYLETIGNPALHVPDFQAITDMAHSHNVPVFVDNTFGTPYLVNPIEHGVDVVIHSTTKWISGHGITIGGAIIDGGKFDWTTGRHPIFSEPEPAYHGLVMGEALGEMAFILRARVVGLRDMGAKQSPFESFLSMIGLETLPLRMQRHCDNALAVAQHLSDNTHVKWVNYPGLANHATHDLAKKYLPKGQGAVIGFGIEGGKEAGAKFIDNLKLFSHLANVGDSRSLAIHPATTTHQQLSPEEQAASGVSDDYVRLAVGIEDLDDILWDLDQALHIAKG